LNTDSQNICFIDIFEYGLSNANGYVNTHGCYWCIDYIQYTGKILSFHIFVVLNLGTISYSCKNVLL